MLIICSGPDTFRARKKAQELVSAFRAKYDPAGFSIETLPEPELKTLLNKLLAPSLFSSKRFIRCDSLLEKIKVADTRALTQRLMVNKDRTIVLTLQTEPPDTKTLHELKKIKSIHYHFPQMVGSEFIAWCKTRGAQLGVATHQAEETARRTEGNTWLAEQELTKLTAFAGAPLIDVRINNGTIFDIAEKFLRRATDWRTSISNQEADQILPVLLSQTRAALRVRDHATDQMHPYIVKKLSSVCGAAGETETLLLACLQVVLATRTGLTLPVEKEFFYP